MEESPVTHIVDLVDIDRLEAGLRDGTFSTKEKFYSEVARMLGRKIEKLEMDALRNSMFPHERSILIGLPYQELVNVVELSMVEHRLGSMCVNGIHLLESTRDFCLRKGRPVCRACDLRRSAESKRRARQRARAENPKPKKPRKPKVRQKRIPKQRVELTIKQVLEIRADYENNGGTYGWATSTAKKYNMSVEAIRAIAKRRTWKDV